MKFEVVEPPEAPRSEVVHESPEIAPAVAVDAEDAVAGLAAATERLSADVAAESERIDASLAELAQVIARSSAPSDGEAGPPDNFRADRFRSAGGEERERGA
ncbi:MULTISPECIES: hypothetical protein [Actinomadura]|uniref:Uncharacterized protein n=1 Tax=Actinomadura litoris TaxID=2678616 RepID=A0A7K1L878_9ACTN|nr:MULTISPECIES: hypothetical protein [Actinomadura]MBT2210591.1 hypothetical protein [Actinomadura sp. NEAU-AAG7]MUN40416.1 hypothetical protein [Actinomadura litoris]